MTEDPSEITLPGCMLSELDTYGKIESQEYGRRDTIVPDHPN